MKSPEIGHWCWKSPDFCPLWSWQTKSPIWYFCDVISMKLKLACDSHNAHVYLALVAPLLRLITVNLEGHKRYYNMSWFFGIFDAERYWKSREILVCHWSGNPELPSLACVCFLRIVCAVLWTTFCRAMKAGGWVGDGPGDAAEASGHTSAYTGHTASSTEREALRHSGDWRRSHRLWCSTGCR